MANTKAKKKTVNKSDFVRAAGDLPAKEIVQRAKARGIKLSERYVYVIRSSDKAKARRRGVDVTGGRRKRVRGHTAELFGAQELRALMLVAGLATSRRVLDELEASIRA